MNNLNYKNVLLFATDCNVNNLTNINCYYLNDEQVEFMNIPIDKLKCFNLFSDNYEFNIITGFSLFDQSKICNFIVKNITFSNNARISFVIESVFQFSNKNLIIVNEMINSFITKINHKQLR